MDNTVLLALITIGIPAIFTPIIVHIVQSRQKRQDKEAEWARADLLEQRAADRAAAVAKHVEETTALLINSTANVGNLASIINGKVDEIHVLTNSSYTAALQATLAAVRATLAVLLDSAAFKREHLMVVDTETESEIVSTKKKMEELTAIIEERMRQDLHAKEVKAKELLIQQQAQKPLPVADERTATASERTAAASERVADAAERTVQATIDKAP